jgi:predicted regulator of Ras-like GTPase activity (Roadblock/LC7/MglB family)
MSELQEICARLLNASAALAILLVDRDGIVIARAGETERLDVAVLPSLFAGNSLTTLLTDKELSARFPRGEGTNFHLALVGQQAMLCVLFDFRSSLGLVRLRSRKAVAELMRVFDRDPSDDGGAPAPLQPALYKPRESD